jgi:transposase
MRGIVPLSLRWGGERSFGWTSRLRQLARDYDRLPEILAGLRYLAFIVLMLKNVAAALA